ncbi:MAG TPA: YolD-like family protein [Gallicola sp.]|nr:YolD-like family protein [Gallicola sp.]
MDNKYDDIINLPRHVSTKRQPMPIESRAAQFAPFAALKGYDDAVKETARLTDNRVELGETTHSILNSNLQWIKYHIKDKPKASFTYFIPDERKQGGCYVTITGNVRRIDEQNQVIILTNGNKIPIDEIIKIAP